MRTPLPVLVGIAATAVVSLVLPFVLDRGGLALYIDVALTACVVVGISLLMGFAGQVSLGQAVFFAVGGYTAAMLVLSDVPALVGLVVAPLAAGVLALLLGIPLLRLHGHHLAFATIAMHLIFLVVVRQFDSLGGSVGLMGIPALSVGSVDLADHQSMALVSLGVLALVMLVAHNVVASRPGRALRALATSETAAESAGVPVGRYKLLVFALSGAFAGLAGGVWAYYVGYLSPGMFPVSMSITFVVMAAVGGMGSIWGALFGTVLVKVIVSYLGTLGTASGMPDYAPAVLSYAVYGLLLIGVLLFLPHGVVPELRDRTARWFGRGRPAPSAGDTQNGPEPDAAAAEPEPSRPAARP
ncbi:branched-chain amino acid transport system permease protein [Lipingzhangella halophila]|uniref:Branched-chain amino acid transport system permease protein n=1 Tax=Lipingzhangella halophila TaxID=1783352 RepID=A0A7W7RGS9_9ACTN|nr:branched-chain amino acid ABC transporter permease [Lipingzhangella halophila]MBB4931612.1 branched-chain amino acid transport system permease protein [Lipingzhangella halophila]